jgi:hypothetical protein
LAGGAAGCVFGSSCYLGAEGPWVLEVLSGDAWCGGDLSDSGVEELLSLRRLLPESLAESEVVGEARPPRRVARFSGRPLCCVGSVCRSFFGSEGSTTVCLRFEDDSPMVE